MATVEVFSTNVHTDIEAAQLIQVLSVQFPTCRISFDMEDVDHILRVQAFCENIEAGRIIAIFEKLGLNCALLNG